MSADYAAPGSAGRQPSGSANQFLSFFESDLPPDQEVISMEGQNFNDIPSFSFTGVNDHDAVQKGSESMSPLSQALLNQQQRGVGSHTNWPGALSVDKLTPDFSGVGNGSWSEGGEQGEAGDLGLDDDFEGNFSDGEEEEDEDEEGEEESGRDEDTGQSVGDTASEKGAAKRKGEAKDKQKKKKRKNMRRNIGEVMTEDKLDQETLQAQQEEEERMRRAQERVALANTAAMRPPVDAKQKFDALLGQMAQGNRQAQSKSVEVIEIDSDDEGDSTQPARQRPIVDLTHERINGRAGGSWARPRIKERPRPAENRPIVTEYIMDSDEELDADISKLDSSMYPTHTDDKLNVQDTDGRVLVNTNHLPQDPDIYLIPELASRIKPHQIGGLRMMYDVVVESIADYKKHQGFGCILAHSMGLGKTFQVVSFCHVFLRQVAAAVAQSADPVGRPIISQPPRTVLVIVPVNVVQNWSSEFHRWLPEGERPPVYCINDQVKSDQARHQMVQSWAQQGGVLILGYEMFRLLINKKSTAQTKQPQNGSPSGVMGPPPVPGRADAREQLYHWLVKPGADLVVCDEGHRIKNAKAGLSMDLKKIQTRRRIVLTGYPLQNNMMEYWCMVDFVRPRYLGSQAEFSNMFENPIKNGQCENSNFEDIQLMRYRLHVLHVRLRGFVQRREHSVLRRDLPPKTEYVVYIKMSPTQRDLYDLCKQVRQTADGTNSLFFTYQNFMKIWNHPDVLYNQWKETKGGRDIREANLRKNAGSQSRSSSPYPRSPGSMSTMSGMTGTEKEGDTDVSWAGPLLQTYTPCVLENGYKIVATLAIISRCIALREKVLVFSQSLGTLDVLETLMQMSPVPDGRKTQGCWVKGVDYYRLDGSTSATQREKKINDFNDTTQANNAWVFLVSTRAGGIGINLVAANRVVVLDVGWNPVHSAQAVCRVYRYGQTKRVYVYRLVASNTMEDIIYEREVIKRGLAESVVDEATVMTKVSKLDTEDLYADRPELPLDLSSVHVDDPVLSAVLYDHMQIFGKEPTLHESFLVDDGESALTAAQQRAAKEDYVRAKRQQPEMGSSNHRGIPERGSRQVRELMEAHKREERRRRLEEALRVQRRSEEMSRQLALDIPPLGANISSAQAERQRRKQETIENNQRQWREQQAMLAGLGRHNREWAQRSQSIGSVLGQLASAATQQNTQGSGVPFGWPLPGSPLGLMHTPPANTSPPLGQQAPITNENVSYGIQNMQNIQNQANENTAYGMQGMQNMQNMQSSANENASTNALQHQQQAPSRMQQQGPPHLQYMQIPADFFVNMPSPLTGGVGVRPNYDTGTNVTPLESAAFQQALQNRANLAAIRGHLNPAYAMQQQHTLMSGFPTSNSIPNGNQVGDQRQTGMNANVNAQNVDNAGGGNDSAETGVTQNQNQNQNQNLLSSMGILPSWASNTNTQQQQQAYAQGNAMPHAQQNLAKIADEASNNAPASGVGAGGGMGIGGLPSGGYGQSQEHTQAYTQTQVPGGMYGGSSGGVGTNAAGGYGVGQEGDMVEELDFGL